MNDLLIILPSWIILLYDLVPQDPEGHIRILLRVQEGREARKLAKKGCIGHLILHLGRELQKFTHDLASALQVLLHLVRLLVPLHGYFLGKILFSK